MLIRMLPGSTMFASDVGEPGQSDDMGATGTNHTWRGQETLELMKCYCTRRPNERGYIKCSWAFPYRKSASTVQTQGFNLNFRHQACDSKVQNCESTSQLWENSMWVYVCPIVQAFWKCCMHKHLYAYTVYVKSQTINNYITFLIPLLNKLAFLILFSVQSMIQNSVVIYSTLQLVKSFQLWK